MSPSPAPEAHEAALADLLGAHRLLIEPSPEANDDIGMFVKVTCTCDDEWDASMPPEDWFNAHRAAAVLAAGWLPPETVTEVRARELRDAADALGNESVYFRAWWQKPGGGPEDGAALDTVKQTMTWLRARADSLVPEAPSEEQR